MDYYFETRDLAVGYGGKPLISNISIGINRGEIVTLIGPNGAGKSTILKSITRHLQTVCGAVYIDGESVAAMSLRRLATRVAVVLTERANPELMTCWDVVASGRYPYTGRMGVLSPRDEETTEWAMSTVNVLELARRSFGAISDGQRQRVLLARAICQKPEVIVLDEPTSFLDIRHKLELLGLLRRMARENGITVIMSLHEIDLAQKVSDRIICVKGDSIEHFGTPREIFRDGLIRELYDIEKGSFNIAFGSVELPKPPGAPRVFVISGGGTGIPVFRELQKNDLPFAAGVLFENDADLQVAGALASVLITERPFYPISDATLRRALEEMLKCEKVIRTDYPMGPGNSRLEELVRAAGEAGLSVERR